MPLRQLRIIVKPFKLEKVLARIQTIRNVLVTHIEEVKGYTKVKEHPQSFYRESEYRIDYLPKKYISVICPEETTDSVIHALQEEAGTAEVGDGKIFMMPVSRLIDIHTRVESEQAIALEVQ